MGDSTRINGAYNYQAGLCELREPEKALNDTRVRQQVKTLQPNFSECAYIGTRPLSWARGLRVEGEKGGFLDSYNKQLVHQHIAWNQSGDNVGWGPHSLSADPKLFSEALGAQDYRWQAECFDGGLMRQAVAETEPPSSYWFFFSNCQSYVERVLAKYQELRSRLSRRE
jgi:hypothetical protein